MPITERVATDLPVTIKTSTYTLLPGDWGREIQFQNASAVSANLPAVADAGNGYNVVIRNIGTGTLTIDPAGSEQINGGSTASLSAGDSLWIRSDGTEWKSIASGGAGGGGGAGGLQSMQAFTSSGTWTKPAGITKVKVTVIGAGGGGGNTDNSKSTSDSAAGGGGGGTSIKLIDVSAISSETVTIGSGGAGATSSGGTGSSGGNSSFGAHCSATGGSGGEGATLNSGTGTPGNGGAGSSGDINLTGWAGMPGDENEDYGGGGGASFLGGGAPVTVNPTGTPQTGASGVTPGAGGAAGYQNGGAGGTDSDGGDGADGIVIVEEYA